MRYETKTVKLSNSKLLNLTFIHYEKHKELVKAEIVSKDKIKDSSLKFVIDEWEYDLFCFKEDCYTEGMYTYSCQCFMMKNILC